MHIGRQAKTSTGSEAWEMLSDSGASMLSPVNSKGKGKGEEKSDSMRSWKSAGNGQKLDDFGGQSIHAERLVRNTDSQVVLRIWYRPEV
jgi:hypothetical protein